MGTGIKQKNQSYDGQTMGTGIKIKNKFKTQMIFINS